VEHVVPASLQNKAMILRAGVVCDSCNNYFSREVEAPFLNSPAIRLLRHDQGLQSKRGRIPTIRGLAPGIGGLTFHAASPAHPRTILFDAEELADRWLLGARGDERLLTEEPISPLPRTVVSRFLAKLAVGCLADRLQVAPDGLEHLVDWTDLDRIRNHARRGTDRDWPVSVRRVYAANAAWREGNDAVQRVWELDLFDDDGYWYLIFILFGVEFAIHLGDPDISGYQRWLLCHGGESPLYAGRYAADALTRSGSFDHDHRRALVGSRT
jgi:hypothetical protein